MPNFRYNMSEAGTGYLGMIQAGNGYMDGFMGLGILIVFTVIMYSIIVLFGDSKSAFTASAFLSVLVGYALMVIEILSIGSLIAFIGLVVVGIAFMMVSNQS